MSTIDTRLSERLDALSPAQREALLKKLKSKRRSKKADDFSMHQPIACIAQDSSLYALSSGQQRLWFLEQLDPGKPTYHIACALNIKGTLTPLALNHALQSISDRHAGLRTTFAEQHDGVFQKIADKKHIALHRQPTNETSLGTDLEKEINRPFDLLNGPLFRITLFKLNDQHHVLSLVLHHIISDAWSCQVLVAELSALYNRHTAGEATQLPTLPCQYTDFAHWQATLFKQPLIEKQRDFWLAVLNDIQPIALPLDNIRPKAISYRGDFIKTSIGNEQADTLTALCHQANVTLFHGLMSLFQTLLFRYSQQTDFCVGTPVAGRNHEDTQGLIGFFVNSLAIRNDASANLTFTELLSAVKNTTLDAQSHQDIPFEAIVDALELPRDSSVSPIFQVFFSYNPDNHDTQLALSELETSLISIDSHTAKFDLSLIIHTTSAGLTCHFEYNSDIFERATIAHLSSAFQCLLRSVCDNPKQTIEALPLLDDVDKKTLVSLGQSPKILPTVVDIATLFEQQAERTPHKIAITDGNITTTFQALNESANQLACVLREKGVTQGCRVGIHFSPSIDLVVAMLATIKAQATYIPMDTHLPLERLQYMSTHADIALVLTQSPIEGLSSKQFCLTATSGDKSVQNVPRDTAPDQPFYMLYTSGSTGKPKAASVSHLNACNLYHWYKETFTLSNTFAKNYVVSGLYLINLHPILSFFNFILIVYMKSGSTLYGSSRSCFNLFNIPSR